MPDDDFPDVVHGEGYAVGSLDSLGEGFGFRPVRRGLGIDAFGANVIVLPPRYEGHAHFHEVQDELYFVHAGSVEIELDGTDHPLGPGGMAHVTAPVARRLRNVGTDEAVILIVGGKNGYVGREAHVPDGEVIGGRFLDAE
jgi:uncharacterized cupin superfamily protein